MSELSAVLTISECVTLLNVSKNTLYTAIRRKAFPSIRIGGVIRISKVSLAEFLAGNWKPPPSPEGMQEGHRKLLAFLRQDEVDKLRAKVLK